MPTAATFVPVLGDFEIDASLLVAPFVLQSGDNTDVPRAGGATLQGAWRPGVMKTVLQIICPDPTANSDDQYLLTVPLPRPLAPSAAELTTSLNAFYPIITVTPSLAAAANQALSAFVSTLTAAAATITLDVGTAAAAPVSWFVCVDFSHTAIS